MWAVPPGYRAIPPKLNLATEVLDDSIARFGSGSHVAIWAEGRTLCFEDLRRQVDAVASALVYDGLNHGEGVLLRGANSPELAVAFLAVIKAGGVPVMAHSLLAPAEIEYVLENSGATRAIVDADGAEAVRAAWSARRLATPLCCYGGIEKGETAFEAWAHAPSGHVTAPATSADDPCFMVYTSGTTGRPKGILHAHRWVVAVGDLARLRATELRPGEVSFAAGEITSISALGHALLFPLRTGGTAAMLKGRANPERVAAAIEDAKINLLFATPTLYRMLLALPQSGTRDFSSLRMANSGGEAAGAEMKAAWEQRYSAPFYEYFGVSEFQLLLAHGEGIKTKVGSVGIAFPDTGVTVLNESLRECAPDEPGYLAIPADDPGLFLTYYRRPELWRQSFRGRWYLTGDRFRRDAEGYFWFTGRADDVFKSRGYSISPVEIENALRSHGSVREVVVVAIPDARIGNAICAVVVSSGSGAAGQELEQELIAHVKERLAPYKAPQAIRFVEEIPRTGPLAKISRKAVVKLIGADG